jgi:purine-binding chemotaxis protein CheW
MTAPAPTGERAGGRVTTPAPLPTDRGTADRRPPGGLEKDRRGLDLTSRLAELRESFDRSFADPPRQEVAGYDDLLAIRVGGLRYALRLTQAAGLFPDRPVTRLPGPLPALLGVAGFRGAIVPVYALAAVFGTGSTDAGEGVSGKRPRWLVLAAGNPPVALAFEGLDGHLRVPRDVLVEEATGHGPHGCLRGIVPLADGARPIVDVPAVRAAVLDAVQRVAAPSTAHEGR